VIRFGISFISVRYSHTKSVEDASKFDADVASSNNGNALGLMLQIEESVTINSQLSTRNLGDSRATT
jgi:hypothetical protein